MKKVALYAADTGKVVSILDVHDDQLRRFLATRHGDLRAKVVPNHTTPDGIRISGGKIVEVQPTPDIERMRGIARTRLERHYAAAMRSLIGTPARAAVHARKAASARKIKGNGTACNLLSREAAERGISVADMADMVIEKADLEDERVYSVDSRYRAAKASIKTATTPKELDEAFEAAAFCAVPDDLKFHSES